MKNYLLRDILFVVLLVVLILAHFISPFKSSLPEETRTKPQLVPHTATTTFQPISVPFLPSASASLNVSGSQWGRSTCYIGATEGSSRFSLADLLDLGINAYHVYGGMSRWEAKDDSQVYGVPTIAQIRANPNVINWSWWDNVMTNPSEGSDYWWVKASTAWQGNARTLFGDLQSAGIRVILDLRNRDDKNNPAWSPDPPITAADWNEWWEHVFALVYWLNVRNHYNINDFEVQNEPDSPWQGWHGTLRQYKLFMQYTKDAINTVYKKYLPGRTYHLYGPVTQGESRWPAALMQQGSITSVDIHDYSSNISPYVKRVHEWMNAEGYEHAPLWLTEWGSIAENAYSSAPFGIVLLNNLMRGSRPGNEYIYGSTVFALYDYASKALGFISASGQRRLDYYALRMGIRAFQGCRPTYQSITSTDNLLALATRNPDGSYSLLITNQSWQQPYTIGVKLSALMLKGNGTIQRFDAQDPDTNAGPVQIVNGYTTVTLPPSGAVLLTCAKSEA